MGMDRRSLYLFSSRYGCFSIFHRRLRPRIII
jgi:hypothetical protein